MKRGKPLARKPFVRNGKPVAAGRRKLTGPAAGVVDAVYERAMHACEADGRIVGPVRGVDHHIHHRRPRAMGGTGRPDTNLPSNLLLLCPPCHEQIESRRAESLAYGWLVGQHDDPAATAVLICGERWVWLTASGTYSTHPPLSRGRKDAA